MTNPLTITAGMVAADWKEIVAGAEQDLADARELRRDAEANLRRCAEQESARLETLLSIHERVAAVTQ